MAVLESRVHSRRLNNLKRILHIIEIPDEMISRPQDLKIYLPSDYNLVPAPISCQEFGDAWLESKASLGLIVPSIPGGPDGNVLVNPMHPLFLKNVKPIGGRPFEFDRRLYRRKPGEL